MSLGTNVGCETGSRTGSSGMGIGPKVLMSSVSASAASNEVVITFNSAIGHSSSFFDGIDITYGGISQTKSLVSLSTLNDQLTFSMAATPTEGQLVKVTYSQSTGTIFGRVYARELEEDSVEVTTASTGVVPSWRTLIGAGDGVFSMEYNDPDLKQIDMITNFIASQGSSAITEIRLYGTDTLPDNFELILALGTTFGYIIGTSTETGGNIQTFQLEVKNDSGWSLPSPVFTFNFWEVTATIPLILSMTGSEGSNDVFVNFSENVYTPAATAASYELGFAFTVDSVSRTATYIDGGTTSQLQFRLSGNAFVGGDIIGLVYTTA